MIRLRQNLMEMDAVIFDLGNVMLDYDPRRFMTELKIDAALHDRIAAALFDHENWLEIDRGTMTDAELTEAAVALDPGVGDEIRYYMANWADHFHAIPENVATFEKVKATGTKTYVLSNFSKDTLAKMEARYPFLTEFDGRIISYEHKLIKPDPAIYHLLIETFDLNPARSVFIDDLEVNIQAALAEGLNGIYHAAATPLEPYFIFED